MTPDQSPKQTYPRLARNYLVDALQFIADLTAEELEHTPPGSGAEVVLRHSNRRANEALQIWRNHS